MGPNIPLTTPIASSMNVSGLNIDVGNATSQTSSTWSIPNISITRIPQIPLIHKCMCLRGKEAHQKSHQRLIHKTSSLILVGIKWHLRNPLGEVNNQPSIFHQDLRFMWAMKSRLMVGGEKDHWKMFLGVDFQREIWD
ncbi:hypothetical protein O181_009691 [Austropuccinia psidii MF-1]|uniref:Uncharacterized protein n=1 Tax=Austropuccinia psidii MF-1 TaxID=1389203 RepID=A0A9Q3GJP9_9BASI|nr:hypothetical protein [Austropuccinia psidii MF-1]